MSYPSRQHAFDLLNRYTSKPGLIKHAIAVEEVMRYFARQCQGDEEEWGIAGLIHDLGLRNVSRSALFESKGDS